MKGRVLITGASGLLGRALMNEYQRCDFEVFGVAKKRSSENVVLLDLLDERAVSEYIKTISPDIIVHSAALRFPEVVDGDKEAAHEFNVRVSGSLSALASVLKAQFVYISTDYVFDGEKPPFKHTDPVNPLNYYGFTKLAGERRVVDAFPQAIILRVPVLYGPVEFLKESAVTSLLETLLSSSEVEVNDVEVRYPAHVSDIASICRQLTDKHQQCAELTGVFQWSGREALTKYQMVRRIAEAFGIRHDHVTGSKTSSTSVKRPRDTQMDNSRLCELGIGAHSSFGVTVKQCLQSWFDQLAPEQLDRMTS